MTDDTPDRRIFLTTGLVAGVGASAALTANSREAHASTHPAPGIDARSLGLKPIAISGKGGPDQSIPLGRAVARATALFQPLLLPAGRYRISNVPLPSGAHIVGIPGKTILELVGAGTIFSTQDSRDIRLAGLTLNGASRPLDPAHGDGLITATRCFNLQLHDIIVANSLLNGISLRQSRTTLTDSTVTDCGNTGIFSLDGRDTRISHNVIERCGNNGIQVWRSKPEEDGTVVNGNVIRNIHSRAGGDGQNGNGINIFRAGDVQVNSNRITDCEFTAIRGNAASNIQMVGNHCLRLGEVALYAEFGFEGALIANNLIDQAATGISVTNFNDGGRLAVVQGNLIRNLTRRKHTIDTRGIGIGVEADTAVTGNVIENAPAIGIAIGWGRYMRDVTATSNIVRSAGIGIGISGVKGAGSVFVTNNMLSGTPNGAIRMMDHNKPKGPDLARADAGSQTNFTVFGNVSA